MASLIEEIAHHLIDSNPTVRALVDRFAMSVSEQNKELVEFRKTTEEARLAVKIFKQSLADENSIPSVADVGELRRLVETLKSNRSVVEDRLTAERILGKPTRFPALDFLRPESVIREGNRLQKEHEARLAVLERDNRDTQNVIFAAERILSQVHSSITGGRGSESLPQLRSIADLSFTNSGLENIVNEAINSISNLSINIAEAGETGAVVATQTGEAWSASADMIEGSLVEIGDISESIARQTKEIWIKSGEELERALGENLAGISDASKAAAEPVEGVWADVAGEIGKSWNQTGEQVFEQWENGWRDLLRGSTDGFENFAKQTLKSLENFANQSLNSILNTVASNLAASTFQPIFGSFFPGIGGAPGAGSGFGVGNATGLSALFGTQAINTFGHTYLGLGGSVPGFTGASGNFVAGANYAGSLGTTTTLSQVFGGVGAGFAGYSLANLINTPRRGPGNEIGGGIGGTAGFILSGGNPLGALAGAFLGSLFGGLFGARPSDQTEGFNLKFQTGERIPGFLEGKRSPENERAANALGDAVVELVGLLERTTGGKIGARNLLVEAGKRDGAFRVSLDGVPRSKFDNPADALAFIANELVGTLEGLSPRMQELIDGLDFSNLDEAAITLERAANAELTLESIRDQIKQITDPKQYAIDQLDVEFNALREVFKEFGIELTELEELYGLKLGQIEDAFGGAADVIDDTSGVIEDAADDMRAIESAWADVLARVREDILTQLDVLDAERRIIEENAAIAENLLRSIQGARLRFVTDTRISSLSNETRLDELLRVLDETRTKALAGDDDAAARIPELVLAVAEANRVFNASSEESARIERHLQNILNETESTANRELEIARENLAANEEQVALLRQQLDQDVPGAPIGPATTFENLDNFNKAFAQAIEAALAADETLTIAGFVNSPLFKSFEAELLAKLKTADASTIPLLQESLAHQRRVLDDSNNPFHGSASRLVPAIQAALSRLGVDSFATGGVTNGLAIVHPGELLYTGPPARVFNRGESAAALTRSGDLIVELRATRSAINALSGTVSAANDDQVDGLNRMAARLGSIESGLELTAARA